jgi:TRAP-type C4-dicarboxylate transport system substrate-binding protein
MANKAKYDALPLDLQKILLDTGREMQGQTVFAAKAEEYEAVIGVKASRVKEIQPEPAEINKARELSKPVIDEWVKRAGPYGNQILSIAAQYASGAKIMLKK